MPQTGQKTTIQEDGIDKDAYTVVFTNGALAELEDLQKGMKAEDLDSVLKVAIGVLKRLQELNRDDAKK